MRHKVRWEYLAVAGGLLLVGVIVLTFLLTKPGDPYAERFVTDLRAVYERALEFHLLAGQADTSTKTLRELFESLRQAIDQLRSGARNRKDEELMLELSPYFEFMIKRVAHAIDAHADATGAEEKAREEFEESLGRIAISLEGIQNVTLAHLNDWK